jgi:hypothetical protein
LSDLQCFVRSQYVEAFSASKTGVSAMAKKMTHFAECLGNNSAAGMFLDHQIIEGQIGIRCKFCANAIAPWRRRKLRLASSQKMTMRIVSMELHLFLPSEKYVLTVKKEDIDIQKNDANDSNEEEEATVNVDV